jgi:hypothetical protein
MNRKMPSGEGHITPDTEAKTKGSRTAAFLQFYALFTLVAGVVASIVLLAYASRGAVFVWTGLGVLLASVIWSSITWGLGALLEHAIAIRRDVATGQD